MAALAEPELLFRRPARLGDGDHPPGRPQSRRRSATARGPVEVDPVRWLAAVIEFVNSGKTRLAKTMRAILPPVTLEEGD
jgi:hypothetical protein